MFLFSLAAQHLFTGQLISLDPDNQFEKVKRVFTPFLEWLFTPSSLSTHLFFLSRVSRVSRFELPVLRRTANLR